VKGLAVKSPQVAIIADDLTGALDVCAPFARRGLRCLVSTGPRGLPREGTDADVICINTASRELSEAEAVSIVAEAAERLALTHPAIAFKKVDSRLKGHVEAELLESLQAFGRISALVAPAVPAQGRFVRDGKVTGRGVTAPIDVAGRLGKSFPFVIGDSESADDMERLVTGDIGNTLLVGAHGLGDALAQKLTGQALAPLLPAEQPLLIAIGSHDPVTLAQVEKLRGLPGIDCIETTDGRIVGDLPSAGVTLVRAVSDPSDSDHHDVLARFGRSVAEQLRGGRFASTLLCGGETAQTVLEHLEVAVVDLLGETLTGIPLLQSKRAEQSLTILTKSGGFGTADDLLEIARAARPAASGLHTNSTGIPA
jgi:uncharacterized protein YgbK (DUF1537 family)